MITITEGSGYASAMEQLYIVQHKDDDIFSEYFSLGAPQDRITPANLWKHEICWAQTDANTNVKKVICFIPSYNYITEANDATDNGNCVYGCFNISNIGWVKPMLNGGLPQYDNVIFWWSIPAADPLETDD